MSKEIYIPLKEVAELNGVARQSVVSWMETRNLYMYPWRKKSGKSRLIRLDVAERYGKGRVASKKGGGYVTLKGLCQEAGINRGGGFVTTTMLKGLSPVRFKGVIHLNAADAAVFRERWRKFKPEYGWMPIRQSAHEIGMTRQGLTHWAKRTGAPLREYYSNGQLRLFIEERQLLVYLRQSTPTGRIPKWAKEK